MVSWPRRSPGRRTVRGPGAQAGEAVRAQVGVAAGHGQAQAGQAVQGRVQRRELAQAGLAWLVGARRRAPRRCGRRPGGRRPYRRPRRRSPGHRQRAGSARPPPCAGGADQPPAGRASRRPRSSRPRMATAMRCCGSRSHRGGTVSCASLRRRRSPHSPRMARVSTSSSCPAPRRAGSGQASWCSCEHPAARFSSSPGSPSPGDLVQAVGLGWRATMADMTSVPDRARIRLPGISSRAYEHPADR
jgi:hypothetical protein